MNMTSKNIPFFTLYFSTLLPVFSAFFEFPPIHIPFLILSLLSISSGCLSTTFKCHPIQILTLIAFAILISIQLITGRGFVILSAGGYVLLISTLFYHIFSAARVTSLFLLRHFKVYLSVLIVFLFLELFSVILGFQNALSQALPLNNYSGYRLGLPADLLHILLPNQSFSGLNSLYLGAQSASLLALISCIFCLVYYSHANYTSRSQVISIIVSVLLFLLTFNFTSFIAALCALVLFRILHSKQLLLISDLFILLPIMAFCTFIVSSGFLFDRILSADQSAINSINDLQRFSFFDSSSQLTDVSSRSFYIFMFMSPIYAFLSSTPLDALLGVGVRLSSQYYVSGDFGFFVDVVLKSGVVWSLFFLLFVLFPTIQLYRRPLSLTLPSGKLCTLSCLISVVLLVSTAHYPIALSNPACLTLFSFSLSTSYYSLKCHY